MTGAGVRYVVPQKMRKCIGGDATDAQLSFRVARVLHKPRFVVEAVMADGLREVVAKAASMIAVPAEMIHISVDRAKLSDAASLEVRAEERG